MCAARVETHLEAWLRQRVKDFDMEAFMEMVTERQGKLAHLSCLALSITTVLPHCTRIRRIVVCSGGCHTVGVNLDTRPYLVGIRQ